ncbi:LLM class flavin-dependent oxidoreductase [Nocardia miyunensis]|uniref:LLM class flavin-dependent oxidoreductase n=1 Tax=Nocardia miyunensis TaxID=282684 RepID=UPI00082D5866|nr:LLM class flavin-dependent oxidoreductase [Nocardia miyunensis]
MSTTPARHVILNVNVLDAGIAPGAWTLDDIRADAFVDPEHFAQAARTAERGTLDALFLADGPALREDPRFKPGRALEPSVILATVAAATEHLGLIGTLSTTFNDPVELAERLLSLDHASGGRLGWNVVTTYSPAAAGNFGLSEMPDRDARYRRAEEFVEVVGALWDSSLDGGVVRHHGEFFDLEHGVRVPPSAQGYPLFVQAGGSPAGRILAGRSAHAVFSAELTLSAGLRHYEHVKSVAREAGRDPDQVKILPGLTTIIGSTEAEAAQRFERLFRSVDTGPERARLESTLGVRLDSLDFDRPLPEAVLAGPPDPSTFSASLGFRESIVELARERDLTLRQLIRELHGGAGHRAVIGTPVDVADTIEDWFRHGAADGFNLMPDAFPSGLTTFVDEVVPILRRRGLFRHEYAESTLRERFGLPVPVAAAAPV